MNEEQIIKEIKRLFGKNKTAYLNELMLLKDNFSSWDKLTKELKKVTGQPIDGHCELLDDVIEWIMNSDSSKKMEIPDFECLHNASYHYRVALTEGVRHPLDWGKRLATKCGGTVHFCDLRICMILPVYTIDTFYITYSRKENWEEDGPLRTYTQFEKSILNSIRKFMKNMGLSPVSKVAARRKIRSACTDVYSHGNASVFDCLFSDIYNYFDERTRFNDKEIDDAIPGVKVNWCEYYDSRHKLKHKSVIRKFPSGDVTQTILDNKGHIQKVTVLRGDNLKEFSLDIHKKISQMKHTKN